MKSNLRVSSIGNNYYLERTIMMVSRRRTTSLIQTTFLHSIAEVRDFTEEETPALVRPKPKLCRPQTSAARFDLYG